MDDGRAWRSRRSREGHRRSREDIEVTSGSQNVTRGHRGHKRSLAGHRRARKVMSLGGRKGYVRSRRGIGGTRESPRDHEGHEKARMSTGGYGRAHVPKCHTHGSQISHTTRGRSRAQISSAKANRITNRSRCLSVRPGRQRQLRVRAATQA